MLKVATEREATLIKFLLCSGFRDQSIASDSKRLLAEDVPSD